MNEKGEFLKVKLQNKEYSGKDFLDYLEKLARKASNKLQNELINMGVRSAKKLLKNLLK